MSDTKDKKKQDKKDIKEFKKAFKKQTGVESDSKDSGKLIDALRVQVEQLQKWSVILIKMQPEEDKSARERLEYWKGKLNEVRQVTDKKAAANKARDLLAVILKVNEAVRKKAKSKPSTHEIGGQTVSVFLTDIPGFDDMKTNERQEALEQMAQKTKRGLDLYEMITSDPQGLKEPMPKATPEDVEALVWGLKSKAQEKNGGPYQKGAMTVPNGEALRKFLDSCPEAYSRLSSHLREQQGRNKEGAVGVKTTEGQTPRGMDFYNEKGDDKPGGLPAGMNALLYQQVRLPNGEKALYVKFETEGSYGHPGDNRKLDGTVPPDRPKHPNDGARARKHLKNLLIKQKEGEDKDLVGLREQTPKAVVEAAKAVVAAVEGKSAKSYLKSSFGTEPKWLFFKKAVPRITLFLTAVDHCVEKHEGEKDWVLGRAAEDLLDKFNQILIGIIPEDLLERDRRMGEEVVVSEEDMGRRPGSGPTDEEGEVSVLDEEDEFNPSETSMVCLDLLEQIVDPTLRQRLQSMYDNEVFGERDPVPFRKFANVVGKSEVNALGPKASKMADRLEKALESV